MFPDMEGALAIVPCSRVMNAGKPTQATGHSGPRKGLEGVFATLMTAALGTLGSSAVFVPDGSAAPSEGAEALSPVQGCLGASASLPTGSTGVPGGKDGDLLWTVDHTGTAGGELAEQMAVGRFLNLRGSLQDKAALLPPDKLPLGTEEASVTPDTLRLRPGTNGAYEAGQFPAAHEWPGLAQEEAAIISAARVPGEHLTPTQIQPDGSLPPARLLAHETEADGNPYVTAGAEEAVGTGEGASCRGLAQVIAGPVEVDLTESGNLHGSQPAEGIVPEDLESGNARTAGRTGGEPEKAEPVEAGEFELLSHPVPVESAGGPEALIASGSEEQPVSRKVVSLRDTRALAEHLREEALKRLPRSVELRLDPPRLGSVTAVLTARGQDIAVKFVTESHEAFRALQTSAGQLAKSFDELGLTLAGFSIDQGQSRNTSSWGERGSGVHLERRRTIRAVGAMVSPTEATTAPYLSALSGSRLDYIV